MSTHRVLIVANDSAIINRLTHRCREIGLTTEAARDVQTAISWIEQAPPDTLIYDMDVLSENGETLHEILASRPSLALVPVIVLTNRRDQQDLWNNLESHVICIEKGFKMWPGIEAQLRRNLHLDAPPCASPATPTQPEPDVTSDDTKDSSPQMDFMDWLFELTSTGEPPLKSVDDEPSSGPWILSVDDDFEFSYSLKLRLQEHGVDVVRAFDGTEGYRRAFLNSPNAIILDYEMPNGNGAYVLRRLKESPATWSIPVIVLTGLKNRDIERRMFSLGADEFLTKPCGWETLGPILQRCLTVPR